MTASRAAPLAAPAAQRPTPLPTARRPPLAAVLLRRRPIVAARSSGSNNDGSNDSSPGSSPPSTSAEPAAETSFLAGVGGPLPPQIDPLSREAARPSRRTVFTFEQWKQHRATGRYWRHISGMVTVRGGGGARRRGPCWPAACSTAA